VKTIISGVLAQTAPTADPEFTLNPTVEQVRAVAAQGPPKPLPGCPAEEAVEAWGAEPSTEMDVTDIDGWPAEDAD